MHNPKGWLPKVLIFITLAYLGILVVLPIAAVFQGAFAKGIDTFVETFSDPQVGQAFVLSLELALGAVVINAVLGTIVAWVLVRQNFFGKSFFNGLIDLPFVVSPVIAGYMIILLFGRQGWFAPLVDATGIKVAFALPGMLLVTIFVSLPFTIREVMPVLRELGIETEQAAHTLGATGWRTFRQVTLPGIRWGLLYGISLTAARALGEFGAVLVVGGAVSGKTETATLFIYRALEERSYTGAYAVAVVLAVVSFLLLMGIEILRSRAEREL